MCLCTNTPGDSNNNAAVLGSFRAARAVRPFVSRGHSLHYNPEDKAPLGAAQGHGGGGIVPHSMRTSLLLQTNRKHTPLSLKKKEKRIKDHNKKMHANDTAHLVSGGGGRRGGEQKEKRAAFELSCHFH